VLFDESVNLTLIPDDLYFFVRTPLQHGILQVLLVGDRIARITPSGSAGQSARFASASVRHVQLLSYSLDAALAGIFYMKRKMKTYFSNLYRFDTNAIF
jgi:hypothetical protein